LAQKKSRLRHIDLNAISNASQEDIRTAADSPSCNMMRHPLKHDFPFIAPHAFAQSSAMPKNVPLPSVLIIIENVEFRNEQRNSEDNRVSLK
jgi:hypothetical protein